jgi:uncharacterized membrane protein
MKRSAGAPDQHVVPSTVAIMHHPIHPMLVVFPIALLTLVLPSDVAYWLGADPFWARMSFWLIAVGFGMGLVAAAIGAIDFFTMKRVRSHVSGWSHMLSAIVLLAVAAGNLSLRWQDHADFLPWGLVLSALGALLVVVTGWHGGTLTFGHAIGTFEHERDDLPERDSAPPAE